MTKRSHPAITLYTVSAVMAMFGVKRQTVHNRTSENRGRLSEPMYRPDSHGRSLRVYTVEDIQVFRDVFAVRVRD